MRKKKTDKEKAFAGVLSAIMLVMLIAIFIIGLSMIPNILLTVQTVFSVDEFGSQIIVFLGLLVGIGVVSWFGYEFLFDDKKK